MEREQTVQGWSWKPTWEERYQARISRAGIQLNSVQSPGSTGAMVARTKKEGLER